MTGSRLGRTVLVVLALGLLALEAVAFTSMGRTAQQLAGGEVATTVIVGKAAARVLARVVARSAEQVAAGVAARLAGHAMRLVIGPVRHARTRAVVMIRAARCPRSVVIGCSGHRRPPTAGPA